MTIYGKAVLNSHKNKMILGRKSSQNMTASDKPVKSSHKKQARPDGDSPINVTKTKDSANVVIKHIFPGRKSNRQMHTLTSRLLSTAGP